MVYLEVFTDHSIGVSALYRRIWAVVDAINSTLELDIWFPDHDEQQTMVQGFKEKSGAGFDICFGCLGSLVIWTHKPTKDYCSKVKIGNKSFFAEGRTNLG